MAQIALSVWFMVLLSIVKAATQQDCSAFSIDGPHPAAFDFYRFYDFRAASSSENLLIGDPAAKNTKQPHSLEASRLINDSSWRNDWKVTVKYQGQASEKVLTRHYVADHVFLGTPLLFLSPFSLFVGSKDVVDPG
jgi:hypothetical protein